MNRRMLMLLSYGHFATDLPQGAIPALLPLFHVRYHLSYLQLGVIVLLSNVSSSVIQPLFGVISDRVSIAWVMPIGTLVAALAMMSTVFAHSFGLLVTLITVAGVGVASFHPEGYKYAGLASRERPATGMSYFSVGGNIGYGLGPAAVSISIVLWGIYGFSYIVPIAAAAAFIMWRFVLPWASAQPRADAGPHAAGAGVDARPRVSRRAWFVLAMLVVFVALRSWVSTGTSNYIPLYFTGIRHMAPTYGGVVASVFLASGAVGTLLGGIIADRWGRRRMLVVSMAVLPPLLWAIPHTSGVWPLVTAAVAGGAAVSSFAVAMVIGQALVPGRIGLASGLIIGLAIGTGGIGATALGAIADRWGVLSAMNVTALLPLAALGIALCLPGDAPAERNSGHGRERTTLSSAESRAGG